MDREITSLVLCTLHHDVTAMCLDNVAGDAQSQTHTIREAIASETTKQRPKDILQIIMVDPHPCITHRDK